MTEIAELGVAMPRTITTHQVNECNSAISIYADAPNPKNGNASHHYRVCLGHEVLASLDFQDGPIKEVGTNGITQEVLIAVLGPYACDDNAKALEALENARAWLHNRTKTRVARGVEGTHTV